MRRLLVTLTTKKQKNEDCWLLSGFLLHKKTKTTTRQYY